MKNYLLVILIAMCFTVNAQDKVGYASTIGDKFHGLKMASSEIYDSTTMVAAHRNLPFGTKVKITNQNNGKSTIVTIKDRGPFVSDRIIDVSRAAASRLGMLKSAKVPVRIEVVGAGNTTAASDNTEVEKPTAKARSIEPKIENTAKSGREIPKEYDTKTAAPAKTAKVAKTAAPKVNFNKAKSPTGLFKVDVENQAKTGFGVQVGVFTGFEVLLKQVATLKGKGFQDVLISVSGSGDTTKYRIILGNYDNQDSATAYKKALKSKYKMDGFVVDFSEL